jgi:DNA-binding transcriptional LysR family regulator
MELRVLRYFLAVAREQNITAAAERLHITQPTLSKQLMDLEEELGKTLFLRGKRKITLTEEGEFLRQRAQEICDLAEKTERAFQKGNETIAGDVYIGCGETEGMRLLVKAMANLRERFPDVRYHLYSGNGENVSEWLEKGLVDFGLFVGSVNYDKYDYIKLPVSDHWGLLMRSDHPLAKKSAVSPQDVKSAMALCSRQTLINNELSGWLGCDMKELQISATFNLIRNVIIMVEEGMGCAIGISGLVNTNGTDLVFRPFEPRVAADLFVAWKKYRIFSAAAEAFLTELQAQIGFAENIS